MHDPMTVIYSCRLFTLWHVDPERDGTDDSCDWFNRGKAEDRADPRRGAVYEALWDMETLLDNSPHYPDSPEHQAFQPLKRAVRAALRPESRRWWRHPRWHVHHWKVQIHTVQSLKRWLFSRCCRCGKGFRWGEAPVSGNWNSDGPKWFRGEEGIYHGECGATVTTPASPPRPPAAD